LSTPSDDRREAEEALWRALKEWAAKIRKAGLKPPVNQLEGLRQAHLQGRLIDELNRVMEEQADSGEISPRHLHVMAEMLDHGLEVWEHVLIRRGARWRPYMTSKARLGARKAIKKAEAWVKDPTKKSKSVPTVSGGGFETKRSRH
jgi:hypothetical protein